MKSASLISVDTETTSLSPRDAKLCGISIAVEPGTGYYIPIRSSIPSSVIRASDSSHGLVVIP